MKEVRGYTHGRQTQRERGGGKEENEREREMGWCRKAGNLKCIPLVSKSTAIKS